MKYIPLLLIIVTLAFFTGNNVIGSTINGSNFVTSSPTCPYDPCPVIPTPPSLPEYHLGTSVTMPNLDYGYCERQEWPDLRPGININAREGCTYASACNASTKWCSASIGWAFKATGTAAKNTHIEVSGTVSGSCYVGPLTVGTALEQVYLEVWSLNDNHYPNARLKQTLLDSFQQSGLGTLTFNKAFSGSVNVLLQPGQKYVVWVKDYSEARSLLAGGCAISQALKTLNPISLRACECSDGIDNDGNGCADYPTDTGCSSPEDDTEAGGTCQTPQPQCSDGIDNDGNGCADYPTDLGCSSPQDNSESGGSCQPSGATPTLTPYGFGLLILLVVVTGVWLLRRRLIHKGKTE